MRRGNVRQPVDKNALIEKLVRSSDEGETSQAPFSTYRDLFVFAVAIGYQHKRSLPLSQGEKPISWDIFANRPQFAGLIYLLGIAESKDTRILAEENTTELLEMFEKYANGGLEIIEDWLNSSGSMSSADVLTSYVLSQIERISSGTDGTQPLQVPNF